MTLTKPYLIVILLLFNALYSYSQESNSHRIAKDSIKSIQLEPVTVYSGINIRRNNSYQFAVKEAKSLITVVGETDVLRYVGSLPGVSQGMEGGMGFFVRGGNNGNNRVELDNVPLYGNTHLFGLFSIFHPDVVESVHFSTGAIPASSGNFLSSLTQITSVKPDSTKYHAQFSISPLMGSLSLSGPIVKNRLSFQLAGRLSMLRPEYLLLKQIANTEGDINPEVADLYLKLHYWINDKHSISTSGYISNDYFKFDDESIIELNWGNKVAQVSWDWKIAPNFHLNTFMYANAFDTGRKQKQLEKGVPISGMSLHSTLNEYAIQSALSYTKSNFELKLGILEKAQKFNPISEKTLVKRDNYAKFDEVYNSTTFTSFGELIYCYKNIKSSLGLRANVYNTAGQSIFNTNLRLGISMQLSPQMGLEASYDQLSQFHHVLEGLPIGWSLDLIVPASKQLLPETSDQVYAGTYWTDRKFQVSGGIYYKYMKNLASYKNSSNIFGVQNTNWMEEITTGRGESYGLELRAERKAERWNFAASYTLSKTNRLFREINNGEKFPFKFDRRHIFNLTGQFANQEKEK